MSPDETDIFINLKFWGESGNGIYLKFMNKMNQGESTTNKYQYELKCSEKIFERYLDDMSLLILSVYDAKR